MAKSKPKYSFFLHFNRNRMQRSSHLVWTVHWKGACIPAAEVVVRVPVMTRYVPSGRQPRATLRGFARDVRVNGPVVEIV